MPCIRARNEFFYQNGAIGWERYGEYLTSIDIGKVNLFGDEYIGQHINQCNERFIRKVNCLGYIGECLRALTNGAMSIKLYDILLGEETPEKSADEAERDVLAEFERLGGVRSGNERI